MQVAGVRFDPRVESQKPSVINFSQKMFEPRMIKIKTTASNTADNPKSLSRGQYLTRQIQNSKQIFSSMFSLCMF